MLTVILTGGGSRRMGRDKALLPWRGGTMLQSLIDKYSRELGAVAVSVDEPGRFAFRSALELPDPYPGMGPLNGIVAAFEQTGAETVFLTGTDLPFGEPELVRALEGLMGDADACVIRWGEKGIEPLFALYKRSCVQAARRVLCEGRKSFRELFESVNVRFVLPEELAGFDLERMLSNVNTPDDYAGACAENMG